MRIGKLPLHTVHDQSAAYDVLTEPPTDMHASYIDRLNGQSFNHETAEIDRSHLWPNVVPSNVL